MRDRLREMIAGSPILAVLLGSIFSGTFVGFTERPLEPVLSFPAKVIYVYDAVNTPGFMEGLEAALEKENRRQARESAQEKR